MPLPKLDLLGELYSILGKPKPGGTPAAAPPPAKAPKAVAKPAAPVNPISQLLADPSTPSPTAITAQPAGQKAIAALKAQPAGKTGITPLPPTPAEMNPPPYQLGMSLDQYIQAKGLDPLALSPKQTADLMGEYQQAAQFAKKAAENAPPVFPETTAQASKVPTAPPGQQLRPLPAKQEARRAEFNIDAYHGTRAGFEEFNMPEHTGQFGVHIGTVKAAHDIQGMGSPGQTLNKMSGETIYSLKARIHNPIELEDQITWYPSNIASQLIAKGFPEQEVRFAEKMGDKGLHAYLESKGYDGVKYVNNAEDPGSVSYIVWDPAQLRSPHAAFDPAKKQSRNLAAGLTGAAAVGGAEALSGDRAEAAPGGNPIDSLLSTSRPSSQPIANPIDALLGGVQPAENPGYKGDVAHEFQSGLESVRGAREAEQRGERAGPGGFAREFLEIAGGLFGMAASPVTGAVRQYGARNVAGTLEPGTKSFAEMSPSERGRASGRAPFEARGTPEEQLDRATTLLSLGVPGIGLTKLPKAGASVAAIRNSPAFKTVEKIFSPTTVDQDARDAEALLRTTTGVAARDTASTAAAMEPFHKAINALPEADRLNFIDHVEGGQGGISNLPPTLRALGASMRDAFELRAAKLTALPSTATAHFLDDYFPHFWQDPKAATTFAKDFKGGGGKQGSGASLKKREIPTIADGIKAGLVPLTTDPIEATMRYVGSMDRFIASTAVLDFSKQAGYIKFIKPKVYGASGHPDAFKVPAGWAPLKGRGAVNAQGGKAYAPEGFARVYNNFIDRGIHEWGPTSGSVYDVAMKASNNITGLELGLSGFHAVTMTNEASISRLSRGIGDIVGGAGQRDAMRMLRGVGRVGETLVSGALTAGIAPAARTYLKGRSLERVYLGRNPGSPDMNRIVDLLEKAGGRGTGSRHATDYQYSAAGSYWKAFRQGALKMQAQTALADIKAHPIVGTARQATQALGRVMSTVSAPIFETYIPRLKNGAFYDTMKSWLDANPAATRDVQVKAARDIWDSIDNRFGELVDDNIFWAKTMKQAAKLGMRSYSWNLGTAREIGGGAIDLASGKWSPRAAYFVALPIQVATMNAVYQYLATGKAPESVQDLFGGQTGGEQSLSIPSTKPFARSAKSTVPERVSIPGYQKDIMGWYEDWEKEMLNKRSKLVTMVGEVAANQDWRGDPIINPEDSAPEWMKQYFDYAVKSLAPISLQGMMKGTKEGSKVGLGQQMLGLKQAPPYVADPEGYARQQKNINVLKQKKKAGYEKKQERIYGGTE